MHNLYNFYDKNRSLIHIVLGTIIVVFPVFFQLTKLPIILWDESRLAMSAYEMYKTNNFLVVTFGFEPEMWSTKPPLMIWLQCLSMHIFGVNEFAVRFPAAIAVLALFASIYYFSKQYLKSRFIGYFSMFILVTCWGFMELHVARTGDYEALLILFQTISVFAIFNYLNTKNPRDIYIFFIAITLGALTKSIAALLFFPGIFLYALWKKKLKDIFTDKHVYFGVFIFIFFVFGYYLLREVYNPGFIKAVIYNDISGRFLTTIGEHSHSFFYYFKNMESHQIRYWFALSIISLLFAFLIKRSKNPIVSDFNILIGLISITFLLLVSNSQTKLQWYNAPSFPLLAILIATFLWQIFEFLQSNSWLVQKSIFALIFTFVIFALPYKEIVQKFINKTYYGFDPNSIECGNFLKDVLHGKRKLNAEYIATEGYHPELHFYSLALAEKGIKLNVVAFRDMKGGESVLTYDEDIKAYIHTKYNYEIIEEVGRVKLIRILGIKPVAAALETIK